MKKEYLKPEMMISLFDTKDVITASDSSTATGLSINDGASIGEGAAASGNINIPYSDLT